MSYREFLQRRHRWTYPIVVLGFAVTALGFLAAFAVHSAFFCLLVPILMTAWGVGMWAYFRAFRCPTCGANLGDWFRQEPGGRETIRFCPSCGQDFEKVAAPTDSDLDSDPEWDVEFDGDSDSTPRA